MCNLARTLLTRTRQEPSGPVMELQSRFPGKPILRGPANYARNMGARILYTLPKTAASEKDRMTKADFHAAKKAGRKSNPMKQSFAQLSKKLDMLEKTLKKAFKKSKKRRRDDSDSDSK